MWLYGYWKFALYDIKCAKKTVDDESDYKRDPKQGEKDDTLINKR